MKNLSNALDLSVKCTMVLLLSAGMLMILGIFNSFLAWDIFSPQVEGYLYAIFGSCVALAAIGVAITLVISSSEFARAMRSLLGTLDQSEKGDGETFNHYQFKWISIFVTTICMLVAVFHVSNWFVQRQRRTVYREISGAQFKVFAPRLAIELKGLAHPPKNNVPHKIYEYIKALDDMAVFSRATLYIPDPTDEEAMWGYTAWREMYAREDGFARFYISKAFEKAMQLALRSDTSRLDALSASSSFEWYGVIKDDTGKALGVLRLDGNQGEDLRAYQGLE